MVSEASGPVEVAFGRGTAQWREPIGAAVLARLDEVVRAVAEATDGRDPLPLDPEVRATIQADQERSARLGAVLFGRWLAEGRPPSREDLGELGQVGRRLAKVAGPVTRVVRANLAWLACIRRLLQEEGAQVGAPAELVDSLVACAEQSMGASLVRIARQFDEQLRQSEEQLAAKEQDLARQARQDPLTGVLNRLGLYEELARCCALGGAGEGQGRAPQGIRGLGPALVFVDLDGFKAVNDAQGHRVGDAALVALTRRVSGAVRHGDVVARYGGDELVVVCRRVPHLGWPCQLAARILCQLAKPVEVEGLELQLGGSAGVAIALGPGCHPDQLLRAADAAMYRAKAKGGGQFVLTFVAPEPADDPAGLARPRPATSAT
jgi:diguanylate cyclase (GGDEF)-like protein